MVSLINEETALKNEEDRLRRALHKRGFRLCKTPARSHLRQYHGAGYQIIDDHNNVVEGCCSHEYDATIEDVQAFIERHDGKGE
jgi:hypothetical protein